MEKSYKRLKYACYFNNLSIAVVGTLSPILFLTFYDLYGISYTKLGFLVFINFSTQLCVDLLMSLISGRMNTAPLIRSMPFLTMAGFAIFGLAPMIPFGSVYLWLTCGTVLFSLSAGLNEVFTSPLIASIPAENPEKEMSKLHSVYAWGTVFVVTFSTLFLLFFGNNRWQLLPFLYITVPLCAFLLFAGTKIPALNEEKKTEGVKKGGEKKLLFLCVLAIFFGGASECTMAQWSSGYLERVLSVSKTLCDILGVAMFGVMLALGRTLHSKYGGRISTILLISAIGTAICYIVVAICPIPAITIAFCALCGLCTSMLWPGTLILMANICPRSGVVAYALMAAGGDLGASVGPQLVGFLTDLSVSSTYIGSLATTLGMTSETLGLKGSMLLCVAFPILAAIIFYFLRKIEIRNACKNPNVETSV